MTQDEIDENVRKCTSIVFTIKEDNTGIPAILLVYEDVSDAIYAGETLAATFKVYEQVMCTIKYRNGRIDLSIIELENKKHVLLHDLKIDDNHLGMFLGFVEVLPKDNPIMVICGTKSIDGGLVLPLLDEEERYIMLNGFLYIEQS